MARLREWLARLAVVLPLVLGLGSCYLPDGFKSEIRLGRNGDFSILYLGDLTYGPLHEELVSGKLSPEEAKKKIQVVHDDLKRDGAFKQITHKGGARFNVRYELQGRLGESRLVTFVRRNAPILSLKSDIKNNTIAVDGTTLRRNDAQRALTSGLTVSGEFRLITDGDVISQNASEVRLHEGYRVYIWKIENAFSPAPRFVMKRGA